MNILLLEDNQSLNDSLKKELSKLGYIVDQAYTIAEAKILLKNRDHHIGIFDAMLPDGISFNLISEIRNKKNSLPIILLTAKDSIEDRVDGLNSGADDYLVKPFNFKELQARIRALMRRPKDAKNETLEYADLLLNLLSKELFISSKICKLSKKELLLIELFLGAPESLFTSSQMINAVYDINENVTPNAVEVLVHRLRKKFLINQSSVTIQNHRGLGFKLGITHD
jgi:DNA-binding response OmpR family regulator